MIILDHLFIKSFFDILNERIKAEKWTTPPINAAIIKSSKIFQETTNEISEGTVVIIAINEPLRIISFIESCLDFVSSVNS